MGQDRCKTIPRGAQPMLRVRQIGRGGAEEWGAELLPMAIFVQYSPEYLVNSRVLDHVRVDQVVPAEKRKLSVTVDNIVHRHARYPDRRQWHYWRRCPWAKDYSRPMVRR